MKYTLQKHSGSPFDSALNVHSLEGFYLFDASNFRIIVLIRWLLQCLYLADFRTVVFHGPFCTWEWVCSGAMAGLLNLLCNKCSRKLGQNALNNSILVQRRKNRQTLVQCFVDLFEHLL